MFNFYAIILLVIKLKTIKVVAAIIKRDNEIMIAQRIKGEFKGMWEFPGGKIETGETAEQALKREIMEEMEVEINVNEYLLTAEYDYPTFHLSMDCFICTLLNNDIHLNDHTDYKWISIDEDIKNINWIPADVQIFEAIQNKYSK